MKRAQWIMQNIFAMTDAKRISLQNGGVAFVTDMRGYYYFPSSDGKKVVVLDIFNKIKVLDQFLIKFFPLLNSPINSPL